MPLTKEQIEQNKKLIKEAEKYIKQFCPNYKLSSKQVEQMAKDERRVNAYKTANKGNSNLKAGIGHISKKYANFTESSNFNRPQMNYFDLDGPIEDFVENKDKFPEREKKNTLVSLKFGRPGKEGDKFRRDVVAQVFEDILNAKPSDFMYKKGEFFNISPKAIKTANWIIEDTTFNSIANGELGFIVDKELMNEVNNKRHELFGLATFTMQLGNMYSSKYAAFIDYDQLSEEDINLLYENTEKPLVINDKRQLYEAFINPKDYFTFKKGFPDDNNIVSEEEYNAQVELDKKKKPIKVDIEKMPLTKPATHDYNDLDGKKVGDQYRIANEINERIKSGQITETYEEAMYNFPHYEKIFAEEKRKILGQDINSIQKKLTENPNLPEKERDVLMLELEAKTVLFDNVLNTKPDIDYTAESVKYYDDSTFEKIQKSVNIIGAINDIRDAGDIDNLTKENVEKLADLHSGYVKKFGDFATLSPDRCLRIASGEAINKVPAIKEWYKSFKNTLVKEGIKTEQDMERVRVIFFDKEDGTYEANTMFALPREDDYYAVQYLFERAINNEIVIDGNSKKPDDFKFVSVGSNGKLKEVSPIKLNKDDPQFEAAVNIEKIKEKEIESKKEFDGPKPQKVTEKQYAENVEKIRASERMIQKYAKNYKLSDFEVDKMARDPNRQRAAEQCRLNMSNRKVEIGLGTGGGTYVSDTFDRIIPARVDSSRTFEEYVKKDSEEYKKSADKNFALNAKYTRPGKVGSEFRRKETYNIFKEMMQYKPSDFMFKEGDFFCDMTPEKRKMAHIIAEDKFVKELREGFTNIEVDPELLNEIDERRQLLMDSCSLSIPLNDVYETKFGAYIDFDKLSEEDLSEIKSGLVDECTEPENKGNPTSDANELLTAFTQYLSYVALKESMKPCEVSAEEFEKQKEADKKLDPIVVEESKFKTTSKTIPISTETETEEKDRFATEMAMLDENGGIEFPIEVEKVLEDGNIERSYVNTKFTYEEAMKNREKITQNRNRKSFEKLANELDDMQADLDNLHELDIDNDESRVKEMEYKAKEAILRLTPRTRFDMSEYKQGDLSLYYDDETYLELQKNLSIISSINDIREEIKKEEALDDLEGNLQINTEVSKQNKLTPEEVRERANRRFDLVKVQDSPNKLNPSKVFRIINGEQKHRNKAVENWFKAFKAHLKGKGIDTNNKMDIMKIKTCTIPDFAEGEDMRSGELKYPCSDLSLEPTKEQIDKYKELSAATVKCGEELFKTAELFKKATKEGKLAEASTIKGIYDQQVLDAKKAQLEFSKFKAETFGKFQEDLANSMSFPKDDEYEKIQKLFMAAQKKELFIEDDPLKEGEYHMVYVSEKGTMEATPVANKVGDKHPMQVAMMNLDKAKGFGTAFNGKLYDEQFCLDRAVIGNTIRAEQKNMLIKDGETLKVDTKGLTKFIYDDEAEALDHDAKRYEKHLHDAKLSEKMVKISKSLQYQEKKIMGLKEAVQNTAAMKGKPEDIQKSTKAVLDMLNKEALHYGAVKDLLHYSTMLNSGAKLDEKQTSDMYEKLATLSIMREYKVGKPQEYATASVNDVVANIDKLKNYQGFKEACKDMTADKLLDIADGSKAKDFIKDVYGNIQKLDKVEKPAHVKEIETKDKSFVEPKPTMPFI